MRRREGIASTPETFQAGASGLLGRRQCFETERKQAWHSCSLRWIRLWHASWQPNPLLVVSFPQSRPVQPEPPPRSELLHRFLAARRHSGARAEIRRRDVEAGDRPVPPALFLPARDAHQSVNNGLAAVNDKAVGLVGGARRSWPPRKKLQHPLIHVSTNP